MNCYTHTNQTATGICKACMKAVCPECAIDTGKGLACSIECESEVLILHQIVDRSKRIYGLGKKNRWIPTHVIMFLLFGTTFSGLALFNFVLGDTLDYYSILFGSSFLFMALLAWMRNRKIQLNY